jgi:hypothetical protein
MSKKNIFGDNPNPWGSTSESMIYEYSRKNGILSTEVEKLKYKLEIAQKALIDIKNSTHRNIHLAAARADGALTDMETYDRK